MKAYKNLKPEVVLAYTIKPIIWGGIASRLTKIPSFFALITGLGFAFQPGGVIKNILVRLVSFLYKIALKGAEGVVFQNLDNMQFFIEKGLVFKDQCYLVSGSGVDVSHFAKESLTDKPIFLLIARLLGDKGIREYVQAASIVKHCYPDAEFHLVGPEDPSPDGIKLSEINKWHCNGIIYYHGSTRDVQPFLKKCNIFVLPSYHEGIPKTVLEAMANG